MALTYDEIRQYCLGKRGALEDFPFGEDPVFKVGGKMFALMSKEVALKVWLKCDPVLVPILRETYPAVTAAPYMDKKHWNQVIIDGSIAEDEVLEMIDNSYALVVKGLSKAMREALDQA